MGQPHGLPGKGRIKVEEEVPALGLPTNPIFGIKRKRVRVKIIHVLNDTPHRSALYSRLNKDYSQSKTHTSYCIRKKNLPSSLGIPWPIQLSNVNFVYFSQALLVWITGISSLIYSGALHKSTMSNLTIVLFFPLSLPQKKSSGFKKSILKENVCHLVALFCWVT